MYGWWNYYIVTYFGNGWWGRRFDDFLLQSEIYIRYTSTTNVQVRSANLAPDRVTLQNTVVLGKKKTHVCMYV